jgi:tRNA-dihydrouridine synthase
MSLDRALPWSEAITPLMLAPLQGLTNRAMRSLFIDWVRPDVVFTEFMRVSSVSRKRLSRTDLREAGSGGDVPLIAQLVGHGRRALVEAATAAQEAGAGHLNLNLGCPYGRMTTSATGGAMLQHPERLAEIVPALREVTRGSFSIKLRAGYDDPQQIFSLLPLFEAAAVDFLILHPRTVVQEYAGEADHAITGEVVSQTHLPVIANGDIRTASDGQRVLDTTGATGLMLGRGAIADPLLFERLRGNATGEPGRDDQADMLRRYLHDLLLRYNELFCGEAQVLSKIKGVLPFIDPSVFKESLLQLKKARSVKSFAEQIDRIE